MQNSGIHPLFLAFGDDASIQEAIGFAGHEGRGRRVLNWEDQFEIYGGFHGSGAQTAPFFAQDRGEAAGKMSPAEALMSLIRWGNCS